jgi:hypothetical protein
MLRIRREQVEAFQPVADTEFFLRIVEHLQKKYPQTVVRVQKGPTLMSRLPDASLLELVQNGVARARSYGLSLESSISAFVVLRFKAAPNFDQHPRINKVLIDDRMPPNSRMQIVLDKTPSSVWAETMERYDPAAWQATPRGAHNESR